MVDNSKQPTDQNEIDTNELMTAFGKMLESLGLSIDSSETEAIWDTLVNKVWAEDPEAADVSKPTYSDLIDQLAGIQSPHPSLGLVPGIIPLRPRRPAISPLTRPGTPSWKIPSLDEVEQGLSAAQEMYNDINAKAKQAERIKTRITESINKYSRGGFKGDDGGDGGTTTFDYSGGSRYNPNGLSLAAEPVDVKLDTGVGVTNFPKFYKDGKDETAPVVIKSMQLLIPDDADASHVDSEIRDFLEGPILKSLLAEIISRARFNNNIKSTVTYQKFVALFNTLSFALSAQCFMDNIIAYQNNIDNRNRGMEALYNGLQPSDFLELQTLRQELQKCLIPPTLYEFIHGLYAPYKQSHMPGSALMLLMPWRFKEADNLPFTELYMADTTKSLIQEARQALRREFILDWNGLFAQTNDTWMNPRVRGYNGEPYVDPGFTTMFVNLQYKGTRQGSGGSIVQSLVPNIAGQTAQWKYNFHTDAPDGWTQLLQTVDDTSLNSGQNKIGPGLGRIGMYRYNEDGSHLNTLELVSTYGTNGAKLTSCFAYLNKGSAGVTTPGFYPVEYATRVQTLTGNTYTILDQVAAPHSFQRFGTTPAENNTKTGLRYTIKQMLEWLLYKDFANGGVGSRGPMSSKPSNERGRSRASRRPKGKARTKTADKDEV